MTVVAVVVAVIVVIIGIFRWKRATENPIKAIAKQSRREWAERNIARNKSSSPSLFSYSFRDTFYPLNVHHDD